MSGITGAPTTNVDDDGVPDEVYSAAAREFEPPELAQLVMAIVAINAWNRIAVTSGIVFEPPGE
jgi:alkylhydroperoxidase family enzyme